MTTVDYEDLQKNIFVFYLDSVKSAFYNVLLDSNRDILNKMNLQEPNDNVPLWMISGGEAINYYSTPDKKTPTKDIDIKLLFTGDYSIGKTFYKNIPNVIKNLRKDIRSRWNDILNNEGFDFSSPNLGELEQHLSNVVFPSFNKYAKYNLKDTTIFDVGYSTRKDILWKCMNTVPRTDGNLQYINSDYTGGISLNFDQIDNHVINTQTEWFTLNTSTGIEEFKIYVVKMPYLISGFKPGDSFPYTCPKNQGDNNCRSINGVPLVPVDNNDLSKMQNRMDYLNNMNEVNRQRVWNIFYDVTTLMNIERYLMTLVGVVIIVGRNGNKYLVQEGVLDLFLDYTAGDIKGGKIKYENRLADGRIPSIVKRIDYCNNVGYIRIPTLNWLLHDQTRMLYYSLRLQQVKMKDGFSDTGVANDGWGDLEDGKQSKYFQKLKGMINTYGDLINSVEAAYNTNKQQSIQLLQSCVGNECDPHTFLSFLNDQFNPTTFASDNLCGGNKNKKSEKDKKRITKKSKKKNKRKSSRRT